MNRFRRNKAALEIRVDRPRGSGCLVASVNCPGARFFFAGGKKGAQAEQMINSADERMDAAVFHAEIVQIFQASCFAEIDEFALDLRADHHRFGGKMMARVILDTACRRRCLDSSRIAAKSDSADVTCKNSRLRVSRKKPRAISFSSGVSSAVIAGFPASRCGRSFVDDRVLDLRGFVTAREAAFVVGRAVSGEKPDPPATSSVLMTSMSRTGSMVPLT